MIKLVEDVFENYELLMPSPNDDERYPFYP
jgi:hypothetical protein